MPRKMSWVLSQTGQLWNDLFVPCFVKCVMLAKCLRGEEYVREVSREAEAGRRALRANSLRTKSLNNFNWMHSVCFSALCWFSHNEMHRDMNVQEQNLRKFEVLFYFNYLGSEMVIPWGMPPPKSSKNQKLMIFDLSILDFGFGGCLDSGSWILNWEGHMITVFDFWTQICHWRLMPLRILFWEIRRLSFEELTEWNQSSWSS